MFWFILLLTVVLVLDCLFLTLLILIQLPKKDAGIGQAFGGGTTDALFGAGSGNALTKMTKYATGIFLVLTLLISVLNINIHGKGRPSTLQENLQKISKEAAPPPITGAGAGTTNAEAPASTLLTTNAIPTPPSATSTSKAPAAPTTPSTNTAAPK